MCTRVFNSPSIAGDSIHTPAFQDFLQNYHLVTGRTTDWYVPMDMNIFVFNKGVKKTGLSERESQIISIPALIWESKYNSVSILLGDLGTNEGVNEKGLVVDVLFQADCEYPSEEQYRGKKALSSLRWVQYIVDSFATVKETVNAFRTNDICIIGGLIPDGSGNEAPANLHIAVSDAKGDSAIIEMANGEFEIFHGPQHRVMTNEPRYSQQLKVKSYWEWQWSETNDYPSFTLPGTTFPVDRFNRANFLVNHCNPMITEKEAVAQMFSIMNNVCTPLGSKKGIKDGPDVGPTRIITARTHKEPALFYRDIHDMNMFFIKLGDFYQLLEDQKGFCLKKDEEYRSFIQDYLNPKFKDNIPSGFSNYSGKMDQSNFCKIDQLPYEL